MLGFPVNRSSGERMRLAVINGAAIAGTSL